LVLEWKCILEIHNLQLTPNAELGCKKEIEENIIKKYMFANKFRFGINSRGNRIALKNPVLIIKLTKII
jgi:hypothetical protein